MILVKKLAKYGIKRNALIWFTDYLIDRRQFVTYKGSMSSTQAIDTGVPQGSIWGPVLFLVYLNDFCCVIESGSILLFADDATYYDSDSDKK